MAESEEDILGATSLKRPAVVCSAGQYQRAAAQSKATTRMSTTNKRKTLERVATAEAPSTLNRTGGDRNKADMSLRKARTDCASQYWSFLTQHCSKCWSLLVWVIFSCFSFWVSELNIKIPSIRPASQYFPVFFFFGCVPDFWVRNLLVLQSLCYKTRWVQERGQACCHRQQWC